MSTPYTSVSVLMPIPVTASMLTAGTTIAEPDLTQGEAMWVSGGNYMLYDERIYDHFVYECVQAHSGRATLPSADSFYWLRKRPSNRYAPFDYYRSTVAKAVGSLTYELQPPFIRDIKVQGAQGDRVKIEVRDAPGGTLIKSLDEDLWEQALGLWELLFSPLGLRDSVELRNIPISPTAQVKVTVSSGPTVPVALGTLIVGEWISLTGTAGGTEYGAQFEPKSYSYIKFYDDGTFEIRRRPGGVDLTLSAVLNTEQAQYTAAILQQIMDVPVAISATNVPGYEYLSTFGLANGVVVPKNAKEVQLNLRVKGIN